MPITFVADLVIADVQLRAKLWRQDAAVRRISGQQVAAGDRERIALAFDAYAKDLIEQKREIAQQTAPVKIRPYVVHEHRRLRGECVRHSHAGGDVAHVHLGTGPAIYAPKSRAQFTAEPVGTQWPPRALPITPSVAALREGVAR